MSEEQAAANTPLESFFDLAYVLAFTQVTTFLSRHLTWLGMLQGAVLLAVLWWAWSCYSWLTDAIPAHDKIAARLLLLLAVAAMTLVSLTMPDAFERTGALFTFSYLSLRLLHVILFVLATDERPRTRRTILRLAPGFLGGPVLLVIAVFVHGPLRGALWGAALLIDYGTPLVRGVRGLKVHANHFAERSGLIIILALGESIAAMGAAHPRISAEVVLAALLGVVLSAALWWTYFDYAAQAAQSRLEEVRGEERAILARDAYSYIHLAMVAGIVFMALGIKTTIAGAEKPLGLLPTFALCCGFALYLLGLNAFRFRVRGVVRAVRFVVAALSCAVLLLASAVSSIVTLAVQTTLAVVLVVIETLRPDEFRQEVRENGRDESE